jgi:Delta carbonic anhydrase
MNVTTVWTLGLVLACGAAAAEDPTTPSVCQKFGPQTPRDLDQRDGSNPVFFSKAPPFPEMNLCNIHFHAPAEHRARDFSLAGLTATGGAARGFRCNATDTLTEDELRPPAEEICGGLRPGDTIEVHWAFSSCDVGPGRGLESCASPACTNPELRVEGQVFLLVNDPRAHDFLDYDYAGPLPGRPRVKQLPRDTGVPIEFLGSTTGPKFDDRTCSPALVSWSFRPFCAKLDISSLGRWCRDNVFGEDHADGVRELVTHLGLLAPIGR